MKPNKILEYIGITALLASSFFTIDNHIKASNALTAIDVMGKIEQQTSCSVNSGSFKEQYYQDIFNRNLSYLGLAASYVLLSSAMLFRD